MRSVKLANSSAKPGALGTQFRTTNGSCRPARASSGTAIQCRQEWRNRQARQPLRPSLAIAAAVEIRITGRTAQRRTQKIALKTDAIAVGLTGRRIVHVSQDATFKVMGAAADASAFINP